MKTFTATVVASMASTALAFAPSSQTTSTTSSLQATMPDRLWDSMVDKTERSKACPWLPRARALDGSLPGDVGFDPFYLSSIPKNFAGFIQPPSWEETGGIETIYWMREAEVKHGRVAMLAVTGWLATDGAFGFPLRFPGEIYSVDAIPNAYSAHDILVSQGSMAFLLLVISLIELTSGATLVQVSKGELTDREAGDYGLDTMGYLKDQPKEKVDEWKLKETNNGVSGHSTRGDSLLSPAAPPREG